MSWLGRLRASVFGTPVYIVLTGLLLTGLFVLLEQSNIDNQQSAKFTSEVDRIEEVVARSFDNEIAEFESALNFTAATHPASIGAFRDYFERELTFTGAQDPGVILIELIDDADIEALESREHMLGNTDFDVDSIGSGEARLIITRTARTINLQGLPLLGFDVSSLGDLGSELPQSGVAIQPLEAGSTLVASFTDRTGADDVDAPGVVLVGSILTDDGEFVGFLNRFRLLDTLLEAVEPEVNDSLTVDVHIVGLDQPVARFGSDALDRIELAETRSRESGGLDWFIDVKAGPAFTDGLGIDMTGVWVLGVVFTALVALFATGAEYHRRELDGAAFELEHARALASTDPLTGLLNRQGLIDSARDVNELEAAALFFIDLDGFKVVNDTDGHDEGDRVLRDVSRRLRDICRPQDVVCRMGGDEFVLFTPGAGGVDHMVDVSNRITRSLAEIDERVTSSVGGASRAAGETTDVKELLRAADRAMYEAKRAGGDRFYVS